MQPISILINISRVIIIILIVSIHQVLTIPKKQDNIMLQAMKEDMIMMFITHFQNMPKEITICKTTWK